MLCGFAGSVQAAAQCDKTQGLIALVQQHHSMGSLRASESFVRVPMVTVVVSGENIDEPRF